jgi:ankyrin repeat protein
MNASGSGHDQVVELLLKANADVNIQDTNGGTALMVASFNGHDQVVESSLPNPNADVICQEEPVVKDANNTIQSSQTVQESSSPYASIFDDTNLTEYPPDDQFNTNFSSIADQMNDQNPIIRSTSSFIDSIYESLKQPFTAFIKIENKKKFIKKSKLKSNLFNSQEEKIYTSIIKQ